MYWARLSAWERASCSCDTVWIDAGYVRGSREKAGRGVPVTVIAGMLEIDSCATATPDKPAQAVDAIRNAT
jgi:hypothetical protein